MVLQTGEPPADTSTLDVLRVLYERVLDVGPDRLDDPGRDRFLLSKGHNPSAYYAVLAAGGFLPEDVLRSYGELDSPLGHHPDRLLVPGVEISSGSLGHGLPIAVGLTLGLRALDLTPRVFCLLGDAELAEGSNAEAVQYAGRAGLEALHAVVVDNGSDSLGWPGGIAERFTGEGWAGATVDGRDHDALERAFTREHAGRPVVVVAQVEPR